MATRSRSSNTSNEDLMNAITGLQKSQADILSTNSKLSKDLAGHIVDMRKKFDKLYSQILELKAENSSLRSDLVVLNNKVVALETTMDKPSQNSSCDVPQLIHEMLERDKCSSNVIIHSLPESSSEVLANRITDDHKSITDVLNHCDFVLPVNAKLVRLGRPVLNKTRPLKVILSSKEDATSLIGAFVAVKKSGSIPFNDSISIVRDKAKMERDMLRAAHQEHSRRVNAGETNLRVGYHNGVPKVLSVLQKNGPGGSQRFR